MITMIKDISLHDGLELEKQLLRKIILAILSYSPILFLFFKQLNTWSAFLLHIWNNETFNQLENWQQFCGITIKSSEYKMMKTH